MIQRWVCSLVKGHHFAWEVFPLYQALYRKWRPQTFDQVIGQKHITDTLKNQVKSGRLSHAYIFIGTRGTGKTTCARILARAVNCEHPVDGNPCGECAACRGILDGSILDVVELDAASNNGVDNVRALREEAIFSPASVKKRVYIVDEVHMMSTSAFNALLKILEEPPEHLMFILATTELQKVPATILSRCQRHSFKRIDTPEIAQYLEYIAGQEQLRLSHEAAELIAQLAEGGVRDALSLLDQCAAGEEIDVDAVYSALGLAGNRRVVQLLDQILRHDAPSVLRDFHQLWMDGKDPATLLGELSALLRDTLMLRVAPKTGLALISGAYDSAALTEFGNRMTTEELLCALETIQSSLDSIRVSSNPRLTAELCLVSLCDNRLGESLDALRARVSRLEETLKEGIPVQPSPPVQSGYPAEEPEDELDFEQFREEQPEDVFFERPSVGVETSTPKVDDGKLAAPAAAEDGAAFWPSVLRRVVSVLPPHERYTLQDETKVSAHLSGDTLYLEALPGFAYGRVNRQEVLQAFAEAARAETGREIRVVLSERSSGPETRRDLNELKQIREMRIIDNKETNHQ